jgi:hypothetical protein
MCYEQYTRCNKNNFSPSNFSTVCEGAHTHPIDTGLFFKRTVAMTGFKYLLAACRTFLGSSKIPAQTGANTYPWDNSMTAAATAKGSA